MHQPSVPGRTQRTSPQELLTPQQAASQQSEAQSGHPQSSDQGEQKCLASGADHASAKLSSSLQMEPALRVYTEMEALGAVKPLLKALYQKEILDHDHFKKAAKKATRLLMEGNRPLDARTAVKESLSSMVLELAASRVQ